MSKSKKFSTSLVAMTIIFAMFFGFLHISFATESSTETSNDESSASASSEQNAEEVDENFNPEGINIAMLKGPTAMGAASLMLEEKEKSSERNYNFTLMSSPNELVPRFIKGQFQMAAVPANLAANIYNKTNGNVQVLAINTLGVLYIVQNGESEVKSFTDLDGKTIYASGKGASPEASLNYLADKYGVKLNVEWKSEHAECLASMAKDEGSLALLPQPFVTVAQTKNENIKVVLDLNKEWENSQDNKSALVTGVLIANTEFLSNNKEKVDEFLKKYEESIKKTETNLDEVAKNIGILNIFQEEIAKKALPFCNIHYIAGSEMKEKLSAYLELLNEQNPELIGNKLPEEDFYYVSESELSENSEVSESSLSGEENSSEVEKNSAENTVSDDNTEVSEAA